MGGLRTFLALVVVVGHGYGWVVTGPVLAVQIFYVISGFLISYVLVEARSYESLSSFYLNRCLRLFPVYWAVALGTIVTLLAAELLLGNSPPAFEVYRSLDTQGRVALTLSNLLIFGQDWIMFTGVRDGVFQLVADYQVSEVPVWKGLLIPPAWTLGVELSFYAVAPFILFRPRLMVGLFVASVVLRLLLVFYGPGHVNPWTYRFFPTELALFLAGAFAHQFWMPWLAKRGYLTVPAALVALGAIGLVFAVNWAFVWFRNPGWVPILIGVAASLPFLFEFQRRSRLDRRIGDLSYPIYIVHWPIYWCVSFVWDRLYEVGYTGLDELSVILVLTIGASILLVRFVAEPVEALRRRVRGRRSKDRTLARAAVRRPTQQKLARMLPQD